MIYPVYSTIHLLNNGDLRDSSIHPLKNSGLDSKGHSKGGYPGNNSIKMISTQHSSNNGKN